MFEDLQTSRAAWLGAAALALSHAFAPAAAHACSGFSCGTGSFFLEPGSQVPANTPALLWFPPRDFSNPSAVEPILHVTRIDGGAEQEVTIEVMAPRTSGEREVQLLKGLTAGAHYRLWVEGDSACLPEPIEIVAGEEAPYPEQLGTIVTSKPKRGEVTVATVSGSCDTQLPAVMVDVDVELAAEAKPWAALLQYTTRVDAKPWVPQSSLSGGPYVPSGAHTKVFAECPGERADGSPIDPGASHDGVAEGTHQLRIEASLPGIITVLYTDPVELELECGAAPAAEPDDSTTSAGRGDQGVPADDEPQAGSSGAPPGAADGGATPADPRTSVNTRRSDGGSEGCAVRAVSARGHAGCAFGWSWLPSALVMFRLRTRLRRRTARLLTRR